MVLGEITKKGKVVYVRGEYFVTELESTIYASMFRVYMGTYWRCLHVEGNGYGDALNKCIQWIGKRKCFREE
jgi:hypothetical protein